MKTFIRHKLHEALNIPSFRVPKQINLTDEELNNLKSVNWTDLKIEDLGGNGNIAHLKINFPFKTTASDGIIVDIQVLHDKIYQIHLHMTENLQRLGLGYKIHKALINDLGHLYSGKGRVLNPNAIGLWDKLKKDPDLECYSNSIGDMCIVKQNPDKKTLKRFMV